MDSWEPGFHLKTLRSKVYFSRFSLVNQQNIVQRSAWILLCSIVMTIPLIYGAVHPLILGVYVFLILIGLGGYLLFGAPEDNLTNLSSFWVVVPIIVILYLFFQAIPIPMGLLEILSPSRAGRLEMVNSLAGTNIKFAPISELGEGAAHRSIWLLSIVIYYFALIKLLGRDRKYLYILCACMILVGAAEALYGLLQFVKPQTGILWLEVTRGRAAHGTIIYKNQFASFLNMIWPVAVGCASLYFLGETGSKRQKRTPVKITRTRCMALVCAIVLMMLAVTFSLSRGGILSMLVVIALLLLIMPFSRKGKIISVGLLTLIIISYSVLLGLGEVVERFASVNNSEANRIALYLSSLPLLWDHWLTGIGMGSYKLLSPVYLEGFPAHKLFDRVHNEYLEILIELGIPMATLFFTWLLSGMSVLLIRLKAVICVTRIDAEQLIIAMAACCGLIGFLIHGFVDFGWRLPANVIYAATLLAIITVSLNRTPVNQIINSTSSENLEE